MASWKNKIIQALWLLLGVGVIVLFGAAMSQKNQKYYTTLKVEIEGVDEQLFIDETDVEEVINANNYLEHKKIKDIDLRLLETALEKTPWVRNAELFFDNQQILQVKIEERQPIARVFTSQGSSFYVDSGAVRLPLSNKVTARVPMFTNFPSDNVLLSAPDSLLLRGVVEFGKCIMADSFWRAQVAQMYINPDATFEMIPTIGNQVILFGNASDVSKKFKKLASFYKKAWLQSGMNTYTKLDLQYKNQIVASRKNVDVKTIDSSRIKDAEEALLNTNMIVNPAATNLMLGLDTNTLGINPNLVYPIQKKVSMDIKKKNNKKANISFSNVKQLKSVEKHPN